MVLSWAHKPLWILLSGAILWVTLLLEGLGDHHFPVTTNSPESQRFFDQRLRLTYAFNHSEALRSFKEAARLDPQNAIAYWGWALVLGPNLNLPMVPDAYRRLIKPFSVPLHSQTGPPSVNAPLSMPWPNDTRMTLKPIARPTI